MMPLFVKFCSEILVLLFFTFHVPLSLFHLHYTELDLLPEPPTLAGGFPATLISTVLEHKVLPSPLPSLFFNMTVVFPFSLNEKPRSDSCAFSQALKSHTWSGQRFFSFYFHVVQRLREPEITSVC